MRILKTVFRKISEFYLRKQIDKYHEGKTSKKDTEEIMLIYTVAAEFAPEYDREKIMRKLQKP